METHRYTVITHAAVPCGASWRRLSLKVIPPRLLFAGVVLAMLPDADVLAFTYVAYGNVFAIADLPTLLFRIRPPLLCVPRDAD